MSRKTKKMTDITKEQYEQVNEENRSLVTDFLEYCQAVNRSPETINGYTSDLHISMVWIKDNVKNKEFYEINKRDVSKFQNWCIQNGLSSSRIRRLRSALSSLSNYIENMLDDDYPTFKNIINKIPAPPLTNIREKTVMSNEFIDKLLEDLLKENKIQQACFIAILIASGMRKSEIVLCNMNWFFGSPIIREGMYISPEIRTKGKGVSGKRMAKFVVQEIADKYLDLWKQEREKLNIDHEALFVTKRDDKWERIKCSTVDSWMEKFTLITGVNNYAHAYRHYSATWLKKNGVSIDKIRDFLGHNDSSTSEIYIDIGKEENLKGMLDFLKGSDA